jgi:ethanolamine ammonia-lyase small subunit
MADTHPIQRAEQTQFAADMRAIPAPLLESARARTSARILTGRTGAAYRAATWLELRRDHAIARDAVLAELDLTADLGSAFVERWGLFEVATQAHSKDQFLLHPELGCLFTMAARHLLTNHCPPGRDLQVAIADGLSTTAVRAQVPALLPALAAEAQRRGWQLGRPFLIHYGRVGVINEIGEILNPSVVVLLIGERPGLATAESLSAYMAYQPRCGHDNSRRNLISNIHARGLSPDHAAFRIAELAAQMIQHATSGVAIKERGVAAPSAHGAHAIPLKY